MLWVAGIQQQQREQQQERQQEPPPPAPPLLFACVGHRRCCSHDHRLTIWGGRGCRGRNWPEALYGIHAGFEPVVETPEGDHRPAIHQIDVFRTGKPDDILKQPAQGLALAVILFSLPGVILLPQACRKVQKAGLDGLELLIGPGTFFLGSRGPGNRVSIEGCVPVERFSGFIGLGNGQAVGHLGTKLQTNGFPQLQRGAIDGIAFLAKGMLFGQRTGSEQRSRHDASAGAATRHAWSWLQVMSWRASYALRFRRHRLCFQAVLPGSLTMAWHHIYTSIIVFCNARHPGHPAPPRG